MNCPRCQQENPAGRGFCIRCAYPLPEEKEPEPVYEPIRFDAPQSYMPQNTVQPVSSQRRRPVVIGIVGLAMSAAALFLALYGIMFGAMEGLAGEVFDSVVSFSDVSVDEDLLIAVYAITFGLIGLVLGILGTVFGGKAKSRLQAEPNRYMGRGMYVAAFIIGIVAIVVSAIAIVLGIIAAGSI